MTKRTTAGWVLGGVFLGITGLALAGGAGSGAISVEESGSGDALVLLPGLGCRGAVPNAVVRRLPGRHSVLVSIGGFGGVPGTQIDFAGGHAGGGVGNTVSFGGCSPGGRGRGGDTRSGLDGAGDSGAS
jgi:hypothetical protein